MRNALSALRPVYVIGVGNHRYQRRSQTSYVELGLTAVRAALADAGIAWPAVESAYLASTQLDMSPARPMLRHLGCTGIPMQQVENASA